MPSWISLKGLLQSKYWQNHKLCVNYMPDSSITLLKQDKTGHEQQQIFETEMCHTWFATLYQGEVYFVAGEVTESIKGQVGYEQGEEAQKSCIKLYESLKFGTKGVVLTEETVGILEKERSVIGYNFRGERYPGEYWTAISYKTPPEDNRKAFHLGFNLVREYPFRLNYPGNAEYLLRIPDINYNSSEYLNDGIYSYAAAVRPIVFASPETLVYFDSYTFEENKPLKIKMPKSYMVTEKKLEELKIALKSNMKQAQSILELIKEIEKS